MEPAPYRSRAVWLRVAILSVVVAALAGIGVWVARYQPLEHGSTSQRPAGSIEVKDPSVEDVPTVRVPYQDGTQNSFSFSIRNTGRWGVTITDFPIQHRTSAYNLLEITKAEIGPSQGTVGSYRPFKPVSLAGGHEILIRLTGTFTDCEWYSPGGSQGYGAISVRYRFLGIARTADIALPTIIEVESPPEAQCPRPARYK
jgi:hypothetical protein